MKLRPVTSPGSEEVRGYSFFCPGCETWHVIYTAPWSRDGKPGPVWTFDGNLERPTFSPSLLVFECKDEETGFVFQPRCHSFIREGMIEFLGDCGHRMKGMKVPVPDESGI